jgi:16S rRNA C967 or C1407 C5-methylase (RsmB/RsmF family)
MIQGIEKLLPQGEQADFLIALRGFSDRCIRIRTDRKIDEIPFVTEPIPWFGGGHRITEPAVRPGGYLNYAAADYYIQDAASLLPLQLLDAQPNDRILDLCASPGGKASAISERLGPGGFLIANETIQSRVDVLRHNLARTGRANYATSSLDPEALKLRCSELFEKILVDVPCSGQTLVGPGKHDESAFRPQHVEHCAQRGRRILGAAAEMLAPGGLLVLATCTFSPEENESQIEWLERTFPNTWEAIEYPQLSSWQSPLRRGCYRLWPHRDRCRGGFAAALRKIKEIPMRGTPAQSFEPRMARNPKASAVRRPTETNRNIQAWLDELGDWPIGYQLQGSTVTIAEPGLRQFIAELGPNHPFHPTIAAMIARRHWEPTHATALAHEDWFVARRSLPCNDAEAVAFMSGQSLSLATEMAQCDSTRPRVAWARAVWRDRPIGWLKESANRWNNHLPAWGRMTINASSTDREPA